MEGRANNTDGDDNDDDGGVYLENKGDLHHVVSGSMSSFEFLSNESVFSKGAKNSNNPEANTQNHDLNDLKVWHI